MSPSTASGAKAAAGRTLTDGDATARLKAVLHNCYRAGFTVKSDYARREADIIAMAASLQLISTKIGAQTFTRMWRITSKGLQWLNQEDD